MQILISTVRTGLAGYFLRGIGRRGVLMLAVAAGAAPVASAQSVDLIVGDISSTSSYVIGGSPKAYSLGLAFCNLGDAPASFNADTFEHPIVTQHMYSLQNGQFEQIGQAWVQHLSSVVEQALCSTCNPTGDPSLLGAGCSTVDSASAMGVQASFGAKSEVNAAAGSFVWPRVNLGDPTSTTPGAFKRLQVAIADLPPGPLYFVSAMVVAADDGRAGNQLNNESYRRVTVTFVTSSMPLTVQDTTQRSVPAVQAWKDHGLGGECSGPGCGADAGGCGPRWTVLDRVQGDGPWRGYVAL